ncbi:helicase-exonuclease AddAB subunit AddA [Mycoplasmatota bacterium]|nr:helicase-exonuclease AddAB subunit AddA [Mycoplasmatota bacterium]
MSSVKFTKEQLKAIETSETNLLVSASAGSGKTTVLIERILNKIKNEHWNIDELLIVTFTEAAAFELKQKLRVTITKELLADNSNIHLRKQLPKLANAHISTFHSFCNQVLRKFFYLIDYDAIYKISDDVEIFMIAREALEQLFEESYEKNDAHFMLLVNRFSPKTHDDFLKRLITDLYFKMRTLPFKEQFKEEILNRYQVSETLSSWGYYPLVIKSINKRLNEAENYFKKASVLAKQFNHPYGDQYQEDIKILETIRQRLSGPFDQVFLYLKSVKFSTLRSKCDEIDEMSKEAIKNFRNNGKEIITKKLGKKYFLYREKSQVKFIKENKLVLEALFYVMDLFDERFSQLKREKNLVDFSDLEEMTLKILTSNNFDNEATKYYQSLFKEILIDEFQDTNSMQETIMKAIAKGNNLFMVGDVKQSIYRFRSAEPEIFQTRYKQYQIHQNGELIKLNANYRSRMEILDFINYLFHQLMDEEVGEISYDDASLVFGQKDYLKKTLDASFISFHLLEKRKINETKDQILEKREIEARYVAQQIRQLMDNNTLVYDNKMKDLRPVKYKDIVILSRTKSDQDTYHDIFKTYNIPFLTAELSGYFNSIEVLTVTSILKTIDNPLQDIPLVATLRSPIFQVNERELIKIKTNSYSDYYYDKVLDYIKKGKDEGLIDKLTNFIEQLQNWRESVKNEPLSELIFKIYHETNYYDFVLGQIGGKQRQSNLDLLFERAKQYEHLTSNSLFKFIQLINFLNENDKDLPQARTVSENEDLVRFMTIHKSKGLEFPIVFITNLSKKYNTEDEVSQVLFEKDLGIAFSYLDIENRVKYETLYECLIKDKLRHQMLAEELRLLYVALTRAKERLFLVGTVDDFEKEAKKLIHISSLNEIVLPSEERQKTDYLSLIMLALTRHPSFKTLLNSEETFYFNKLKIPQCEVKLIASLDVDKVMKEHSSTFDIDYKEYMHTFSERLNYCYPHFEKTIHFAKQTIADIKRVNSLSNHQDNIMLKTPKFIDINRANATLRGTSYHMFMQHLDYHKTYTAEDLNNLKTQLISKEIMSEDQLGLIDLSKIERFLHNEIVEKIGETDKIHKEMPFTTLVSSHKVYPELKEDVDILIQGVVDLLVEFEDDCILIDFKSDRINDTKVDINRLKKQYETQISVYKEAMEHIYPQKHVMAYLYLFEINQFIKMDV